MWIFVYTRASCESCVGRWKQMKRGVKVDDVAESIQRWYIGSGLNTVIAQASKAHPLESIHREGIFDAHVTQRMKAEFLLDDIRREYHKRMYGSRRVSPSTTFNEWYRVIVNGLRNGAPLEKLRLIFTFAPEGPVSIFCKILDKNADMIPHLISDVIDDNQNLLLRCKVQTWCSPFYRKACRRVFGEIGMWNVSRVTDMSRLFRYQDDFNDDISNWDVSNVTNMSQMFEGARAFNQPIGMWNVSKVTNMSKMFRGALQFNQSSLDGWRVSSAFVDMKALF